LAQESTGKAAERVCGMVLSPQMLPRPRGLPPRGHLPSPSGGSPPAVDCQTDPRHSVLLFGDSLTLGTVSGAANRPYGTRLAELLGDGPDAVSISGWAGELAMDMGRRLQAELFRRRGRLPSHVVLLGGTNDIRSGVPPEALLQQLKVLHDMVRSAGVKCVAVTVPQCGPWDMTTEPLAKKRDLVNSGLRAAAAAAAQGRGPPLWLADFDAVLAKLPAAERNALFSDSCHFTPSGYDLLGKLVHAAVQSAGEPATGGAAAGRIAASPEAVAWRPAACNVRRSMLPARMYTSTSFVESPLACSFISARPSMRQYVACQ